MLERRRLAGVHQHQQVLRFDALVAGVRRVGERRAARVVVGEDGGDQIGLGRPHAVELREVAVGMTEEAQHRHHAVDRVVELRRRRDVARRERLAQRQQIEQHLDQGAGIAADVAAVGQDLPFDLRDQLLDRVAQVPRLSRPCTTPRR